MTTNASSIGDWSTTANSNTTLDSLSIAENCNMNVLNNGLRSIMAAAVGQAKTVDASGGDTYTASLSPVPDNLNTGMTYNVNFTSANTSTASTLKFNTFSSHTLVRMDGSALNVGDLNGPAVLRFDGTNLQVMNPRGGLVVDATNGGISVSGNALSISPNDLAAKSTVAVADSFVINDVAGGNVAKKAVFTSVFSGRPVQIVSTETGVLSTGTTVLPIDDTIPQSTEGIQVMTLSITPTNTNSTLIIDVRANASHSVGSQLAGALFQDSTVNALAAMVASAQAATQSADIAFIHQMTANTTSAITFKLRVGNGSAGTTTFNGTGGARLFGGVMASSIKITEILP